jgi:3-oxoacyl-ACP reductase-like protein
LIVSYPVFAKDVVNATVAQQYKLLKIPAFSAESRRILDVEWLWGSNQLYVFVYEELATPRRLERMRRQLGRREGKLSDKNAQVSSTRDESETVSR